MARRFSFVVMEGAAELKKKFRALSDDAKKGTVKKAAKAGATKMLDKIKARCPVYSGPDPRGIPGLLRDNLGITITTQEGRAEAKVGANRAKITEALMQHRKGKGAVKGRDIYLDLYNEYGTKKWPGHPFLRPGFDESQDEASGAAEGEFRAMLGRHAVA